METLRILVVDDEATKLRLSELIRSLPECHVVLFSDVLKTLLPQSPSDTPARLELFKTLNPGFDLADAEIYFRTIEAIRRAMVLNSTDIEFFFSHLANTPRNAKLKSILYRYMHSELAHDRTLLSQNWLRALGREPFQLSFSEMTFLIEADSASDFREFAQALSAMDESKRVRALSLSDWTPLSFERVPMKRPRIFETTVTQSVDSIARRLRRGNSLLLFRGSKAKAQILAWALSRHEVHCELRGWELKTEFDAVPKHPISRLCQQIRQCSTLSIQDRLRISSILQRERLFIRYPFRLDAFVASLQEKSLLTESEASLISSFSDSSESETESAVCEEKVPIVPFGSIPSYFSLKTVIVLDAEPSEINTPPTLFREGELQQLYLGGFSIAGQTRLHEKERDAALSLSNKRYAKPSVFVSPLVGKQLELTATRKLFGSTVRIPRKPITFRGSAPARFSATQLETFAQCPAKFFFTYVGRVRTTERGEDRFSLILGEATHFALEQFFKTTPKLDWCSADTKDVESRLSKHFREGLQKITPALEDDHPFAQTLWSAFTPMAARVTEMERGLRQSFGTLETIGFEEDFFIPFGSGHLRGKIDRIDRLPDGRLLIIDYKTGTIDFTPIHTERGQNYQALLYLMGVEAKFKAECIGMLFYALKTGEVKRGMLRESAVTKDMKRRFTRGHVLSDDAYEATLRSGKTVLEASISRVISGEFSPTPSREACQYCEYAQFCRSAFQYV